MTELEGRGELAPEYNWVLCKSPSFGDPFAPLEVIGEMAKAKQRTWNPVYNRAGTASFQLRTNDDITYEILDKIDLNDVRGTVRKCIAIERNDKVVWSGPIWGINGSLDEGMITFNCVGWQETLQYHVLQSTLDYSNNGNGTPSDQIAFGLLDRVSAQDNLHPLWVRPGSVYGVLQIRNRFYVLGQNLGSALQELSDIEAGYNMNVDPVTRELNLSPWNYFSVHEDIKFGYNWGPNNLRTFSWQEDASQTRNALIVISQGAPVAAEDQDAIDEYGRFEEYVTLSGANQSILLPYANAEIAVKGRPLVTYSVTPYPTGARPGAPRLFEDFQLGDQIFLTARKDAFRVENQGVRVFGATVELDDNGNESISGLQFAPQGGA